MERSCTHPELDIDELELDPIPEETHKDIEKEEEKNREPIKYEIPIENISTDDFRDKYGNVDGIAYAKKQSRNMLLGYLKNLQLLFRDCMILMKEQPLNEKEQEIWNSAMLGCAKLCVEQYSMMELLEQKQEMFQTDKDGKLNLDPKMIDPYIRKMEDGSLVCDTDAFAEDEALAQHRMKEKIAMLKKSYEEELEVLREERSQIENDKELHPEDYDKDGNLILRDQKWIDETKKAIEDAKEEIKILREEKDKREANLKKQREDKVLDENSLKN